MPLLLPRNQSSLRLAAKLGRGRACRGRVPAGRLSAGLFPGSRRPHDTTGKRLPECDGWSLSRATPVVQMFESWRRVQVYPDICRCIVFSSLLLFPSDLFRVFESPSHKLRSKLNWIQLSRPFTLSIFHTPLSCLRVTFNLRLAMTLPLSVTCAVAIVLLLTTLETAMFFSQSLSQSCASRKGSASSPSGPFFTLSIS